MWKSISNRSAFIIYIYIYGKFVTFEIIIHTYLWERLRWRETQRRRIAKIPSLKIYIPRVYFLIRRERLNSITNEKKKKPTTKWWWRRQQQLWILVSGRERVLEVMIYTTWILIPKVINVYEKRRFIFLIVDDISCKW